jgi:2-desacetyl-2-hydroxyethyl bacteriochlorophyllide A dehydrogenase
MKAAQYRGPGDLKVIDMALRPPLDDEVIVDVDACGICGTDLHIVEGSSRSTPPVVIGHEYAGTIVEMGKSVRAHTVGERVVVDPNISCGECFYCRRGLVHLCSSLRALGVDIDGGMAEFCVVPARQLFSLGPDLPSDVSAFVEPLSCAVHGIDRAGIVAGDSVVVLGGGPMGQVMVQLAVNNGASIVALVEPVKAKRELGGTLGASVTIDPSADDVGDRLRTLLPEGADVVLECAGLPATAALSIDLARRGGIVEFFGVCPIGISIPLEPNKVYFKELTIVGSYVNPHTFSRAIALLRSGKVKVDGFPIARFGLNDVHTALQHHREGRSLKCMIIP